VDWVRLLANKVDHDGTGFALHVLDGHRLAIALVQLVQQGQRVMVIAKPHGFTWLQGIQRTKDGGMPKALGNAARIKRINGFCGDVVMGAAGHEVLSE